MAGTISFGGIGSGIDTESIVEGLISASRAGLSPLKSRAASTKAAVSTISNIGSLLSKLKNSVEALDTAREAGSFKATSSGAAIAATANGAALPGRYSVKVNQLATEQRTYSNQYASESDALGLSGTFGIQIGSGTASNVGIETTDSLASIAGKINELDARISASVFYDGSNYRLQIRGLDTGAENALTFTQSGFDLGVNVAANTVQTAQDSELEIDTFVVRRPTNQVSSAIAGVTLNLTETTTSPVTISIESDPDGLEQKLTDMVNAYNEVVKRIHTEAGFGSTKASNPVLAGDSSLRTVTTGLTNTVLGGIASDSSKTLASIGINLNNDGTLKLDEAKLASALEGDPAKVIDTLSGTDSQDGAMDLLRDLVDGFTQTGTGTLKLKEESLNERLEVLESRVEREEKRLDVQAELLRRQFTEMDQTVATNQAQMEYLLRASLK